MTHISPVSNLNEQKQNADSVLDENKKDEVIDTLIKQGLPRVFNPNNFINRIADNYNISLSQARECLKEAINKLEFISENKKEKPVENKEKTFGQSGYFYPDKQSEGSKKDEMDSLVSFGSFQRLRFGL